jgi:Zn-dependent M28 family amino/carboxypeptidase
VRRLSVGTVAAAVAVALATATAGPAAAVDNVDTTKLRNAVTVGGILAHERVLQRIANQNGGIRASGTPGFTASAAYVTQTLEAAGYAVSEQPFTFPFYQQLADPELSQVSPTAADYETTTLDYSGSGDVTGTLVPTNDIVIPPSATPSSTSGCEASDFVPASATEPQVALVQRGTCNFVVKAQNAAAAGYDAVIIFNEGQPGRDGLLSGTLGEAVDIPVVGVSFADGSALYAQTRSGPVTMHVVTSTENRPGAVTSNVIAETKGGDPNKVIVVGAHLDSVTTGPGINDNGSGTSTLLAVAQQISALKLVPRQKIRFIFFGAEESGLLGSEHYVGALSDADLSKIYANLNFDMLGSPNYVRFVYDGSGSIGPAGPPGSAQIETLFTDYFAGQGLATEEKEFDGRSDYDPFITAGIPAGGLDSGAEVLKTPEQAAIYGGTAGVPYDICYHEACDTVNNLNTKALAELGDGATHAIWTLAKSRSGFFEDGSFRVSSAKAAAAAKTAATKARAQADASAFTYQGHQAVR